MQGAVPSGVGLHMEQVILVRVKKKQVDATLLPVWVVKYGR